MNLHAQNARVIDAAADRIFERGWFAIGVGVDAPTVTIGAECAYIALSKAAEDAAIDLGPVLLAVGGAVGGDVAAWNDAQPDADTVIAKLRECADAERAKAWEAVPA